RRHRPRRNHRRGSGSAPRSPRSEGMRGRPDTRKPSAQKKHDCGWGRRRMRYPASEKLEIIRIVEQSHLPAKRTLDQPGTARQASISELALDHSEQSPRELALRFADVKRYFASEATVYGRLRAHGLITSPAYVVIKAAEQFHTKTTRLNEMWQNDFTYFKI